MRRYLYRVKSGGGRAHAVPDWFRGPQAALNQGKEGKEARGVTQHSAVRLENPSLLGLAKTKLAKSMLDAARSRGE